VFRLLTEPELLAAAAVELLSDAEQARLRWPKRPRGLRAAAWSVGDAFLVDEATDVVGGTATFGHVVADEAQDLSPMQLRAIGRRCRFGSATLLGDLAQRTTPWSAGRWEDALGHLGRRSARVEGLEFDQVVLVDPAEIADPALGVAGLRRLYTALTRAVLALRVVHARDLPPALRAPEET